MNPIRVLIADDHALFREGVQAALSDAHDMRVAGEAADGPSAVSQALSLAPDVVLMDIHMPLLNGIEATRRIVGARPEIGIVMLTMLEDDTSVFAAMRAGARGYLLKGADKAEVLRTIRAVASGEALFGSAIARRISLFFERAARAPAALPELTEREREILAHIARGEGNAQIAERLAISPKTLSNHVSNIFAKLQVADRAEAIARAKGAGLG